MDRIRIRSGARTGKSGVGSTRIQVRALKPHGDFDVVIKKDEKGYLVAGVHALKGCHTQARSLGELKVRIREAVRLCAEVAQADG